MEHRNESFGSENNHTAKLQVGCKLEPQVCTTTQHPAIYGGRNVDSLELS
jgi:hypothetical protein